MSISISYEQKVEGHEPRIVVTLECEDTSDIFCRGFERFQHEDGYIGSHKQAMAAGWMERQTDQGRAWVCPRCSGKGSPLPGD